MFEALDHEQSKPNPDRLEVMREIRDKGQTRGLMQNRYKVSEVIQSKVYTHIKTLVKISPDIIAKYPPSNKDKDGIA